MNLLVRFAALWRPRIVRQPTVSGLDPALLAALRRESDIIASSFEEDSLLAAAAGQIERGQLAEAIRTIRGALSCCYSDAKILAEEVRRALEGVHR